MSGAFICFQSVFLMLFQVQYQQPPPHQYPPSSNVPVAAMPQDLLPRYTQQQQGPPPAQPPQHLQHITIQGSATAGDGVGYSMQQASGQVQQPAHPAVNQSGPVKLYMEGIVRSGASLMPNFATWFAFEAVKYNIWNYIFSLGALLFLMLYLYFTQSILKCRFSWGCPKAGAGTHFPSL